MAIQSVNKTSMNVSVSRKLREDLVLIANTKQLALSQVVDRLIREGLKKTKDWRDVIESPK